MERKTSKKKAADKVAKRTYGTRALIPHYFPTLALTYPEDGPRGGVLAPSCGSPSVFPTYRSADRARLRTRMYFGPDRAHWFEAGSKTEVRMQQWEG